MSDSNPEDPRADVPASHITLAPGIWVSSHEFHFRFSRSGGPGGQNVNKVNSKAELRLPLTAIRNLTDRAINRLRQAAANRMTSEGDLLIVSDSERSQERNREECLNRLRLLIQSIVKDPKPRRKTRPSKSSVDRRIESKKARGAIKKQRMDRFD